MRNSFLFLAGTLLLIPACSGIVPDKKKDLVFIIQTHSLSEAKEMPVYIDWSSVTRRMGKIAHSVSVIDLNNEKEMKLKIVDSDQNHNPEGLTFTMDYDGSEPVRTFLLRESSKQNEVTGTAPAVTNSEVVFLKDATSYLNQNNMPGKWSETVAKSVLSFYPYPAELEVFSRGRWSYTNGFFLNALYELYKKEGKSEYLTYLKNWADLFVLPDGSLDKTKYSREIFELDNILPGRLLIFLHRETGDSRYLKAAHELISQLEHQPRTSEGGFWHKKVYTHMMWLDGIYMADVFLAQYGSAYHRPEYLDEAVRQIELICRHTRDPKTGLLYHGWDESKNTVWANKETGTSPEFWGRAIGWYMMALVDVLDYMPQNHPQRDSVFAIFRDLSQSVARYQDSTGMWYQVIDKGNRKDNWLESSCTAMFGYAFAKGAQKGYLNKEYSRKAENAFVGLIRKEVYFDEDGRFYLNGTVKVGTLNLQVSKGDYNYYIGVDRRINDFKGVAAFLYLAMALER